MTKSYERLGIVEFGEALLTSNDLDPVYVMLAGSGIEKQQLTDWMLAYWCFYHAGVASWCAEDHRQFWDRMDQHVRNKGSKRGAERRHFRGEAAVNAVVWLRHQYGDSWQAVLDITRGPKTFSNISTNVQKWPMFGPWIGFKIADMLERCAGTPVDFSDCHLDIYQEPAKAAVMVAETLGAPMAIKEVCDWLETRLCGFKAPPHYDRPVNVQEIETVLCKWKSHMNGHYPVGKDSHEVREHLDGWGGLAERMKEFVYG